MNLLLWASDEYVQQCIDTLSQNKYTHARMLANTNHKFPLPLLLYAMRSEELLSRDTAPGIMARENTDTERCLKFFNCIGEILGLSDMEARKQYIVKLLTTFVDNDLTTIALSIHSELTRAILLEMGLVGTGDSPSRGGAARSSDAIPQRPVAWSEGLFDDQDNNYRRQKSMELHAAKTLEDEPTSLKRQRPMESEIELLDHMNEVKTYLMVHKRKDSPEMRSVNRVMHFLRTAAAKRARLPRSQQE